MTFSLGVLGMAALGLAGCGLSSTFSGRASDFTAGFRSAVAGDEPRAVLIAQQIMHAGGNAADAVIAGYFAMSVTLPSAASLGGGGICLVSDGVKRDDKDERQKVQALIFTHNGGVNVAAPSNVRGMYALHAKYGNVSWQRLLAPAESLARFGVDVSRAMAARLKANAPRIEQSPGLRLIFTNPGAGVLKAGDRLQQIDLGRTLSTIRRFPARHFRGAGAKRMAAAYQLAGADVTARDIENHRPVWRAPLLVDRRNKQAAFPPTAAGVVAAQMWAALYREGLWRSADDDEKPHVLAQVTRRVFSDAGHLYRQPGRVVAGAERFVGAKRVDKMIEGLETDGKAPKGGAGPAVAPLPADRGSATIVAADQDGLAVACGFTLNRAMGAAKLVPRTGIVMAAPPNSDGRGVPAISLMLLRQESQNQLEYLGAASGGPAAPVAVVNSALRTMVDEQGLEPVQKEARYFPVRPHNQVLLERGAGATDTAKHLTARGYRLRRVGPQGRLNAFICPRGFEGAESRCEIRTDPRGLGYAEGK